MSFLKRLMPLRADISLQVEKLNVQDGEPIKGIVNLESKEAFKIEVVRLEVRVEETWKEWRQMHTSRGSQSSRTTVHATVYSNDVPLSEPFDIARGEKKDFPFEVMIPMYQPTRGQITYSLKAVASVKGRPDVTKEAHPTISPSRGV